MKAIYLLSLILLLSSCDKSKISLEIPKKNFEGLWIVNSVIGPVENDAALPAMEKFNKGRWIKFEKDSTYTTNIKGQYDYGKYIIIPQSDDSVVFKSFRGDSYPVCVRYNMNGSGKILNRISVPEMTGTYDYFYNCSVRDYHYRDIKYDTYSTLNNQWRLPAENSENDSLLIARVVNHIDFWIAYLNTANKLEASSFDYNNLNTCFIFSSYGIQLTSFKKWESSFKTLFYSREEGERAYKLIANAIFKCEYVKNDNAYEQGIDLFSKLRWELLNGDKK